MKRGLMLVLFSAVCTGVRADFSSTEGLVCSYRFDGPGAGTDIEDISGHGLTATASGNVVSSKKTNAAVFDGFSSTTSHVIGTNVVQKWESFTAVAWVRNPNLTIASRHLIVRSGGSVSNPDGSGNVNTWQAWLTTDGRLALGVVPNWKAADYQTNNVDFAGYSPAQLTWEQDVWYQVAVICDYETAGSTKKRHFRGYVTRAGATSIGEPVSVLNFDNIAGWGSGNNLIIGAARKGYYGTGCPEGAFNGQIAGAAYFSRALSTEELLHDVQTFALSFHPTEDFADFYWKLGEKGPLPTAADATGNDFVGTTEGRVCGVDDVNKRGCYRGFSQMDDRLSATFPGTHPFKDWFGLANLVLWVKNPVPSGSAPALLAGAMRTERTDLQSWRVNVEKNGAVGISMQPYTDAASVSVRAVGEPYDWGHKWHLVSIRFDTPNNLPVYTNITQNADGSSTTNWTTGSSVRMRVYVAPATERPQDVEFKLMAEGRILKSSRALDSGSKLVFGSIPKGYARPFWTDDVLGTRGSLGEIAFSRSGWFELDYLRSRLTRYAKEPGLMMIFR